jgi:hypothetical protein
MPALTMLEIVAPGKVVDNQNPRALNRELQFSLSVRLELLSAISGACWS